MLAAWAPDLWRKEKAMTAISFAEGYTVTRSPSAVRGQEARAAVLALIAGYIDSYTLLNYKVYASFMSGNTTLTRVGGQSVTLGFVTDDLNHLAEHLALAVKRVPVPQSQGAWDTHGRRAAWLAGIWTAFLIGAALAGAATSPFAAWTLLPPILLLLSLAALDRATGAGTGMSREVPDLSERAESAR